MIKNRTAQLVYLSMACAFGLVAFAASLGLFDYKWRWDFYIHFTNISNYLCIGMLFLELIQTIRKKKNDYVSVFPIFKFVTVLGILLTFIIFNVMLAPIREQYLNFTVASIMLHVVIPILYIADWFLFYERGKVKMVYPFISMLLPLTYVAFVFIHAAMYKFDSTISNYIGDGPFIYPYFFLNVETQGVGGVIKWVVMLSLGFVAAGFLFYGIDRVLKPKQK